MQADRIAHQFGIGENYQILPFRGLYWELKNSAPFKINTNLYPVPDLNVPFLGIHFTPSADKNKVTIGPTALIALGRENYRGIQNFEPIMAFNNIMLLSKHFLLNNGNFRKYVKEQSLSLTPFLLNSAKKLIPEIKYEHIKLSNKVGIRAQLFNKDTSQLVDDFLYIKEGFKYSYIKCYFACFYCEF